MVYGLWLSADGLTTQQYRQDVIANNLANVDTPGFKPDRVAFAERMVESQSRNALGTRHDVLDAGTGGLFELPAYTDFEQPGSLVSSSNPLDIAIRENGFLTVQTPDGPRYTRDGHLVMDAGGTLRHGASNGLVVGADGRAIALDPSSKEPIKVDANGRISQGSTVAGVLSLVDFADRQLLAKAGENLFDGDRASRIEANVQVKQYAYEASGVEPSKTLVDMISATRAYEMNATLITMQDQSLGRLVNDVGRIG